MSTEGSIREYIRYTRISPIKLQSGDSKCFEKLENWQGELKIMEYGYIVANKIENRFGITYTILSYLAALKI